MLAFKRRSPAGSDSENECVGGELSPELFKAPLRIGELLESLTLISSRLCVDWVRAGHKEWRSDADADIGLEGVLNWEKRGAEYEEFTEKANDLSDGRIS